MPDKNEEMLEDLAVVLTSTLLGQIKSGEAAPSTLNVARQWLKDNNMELSPSSTVAADLSDALGDLPFDESDTDPQGSNQVEGLSQLPFPSMERTGTS